MSEPTFEQAQELAKISKFITVDTDYEITDGEELAHQMWVKEQSNNLSDNEAVIYLERLSDMVQRIEKLNKKAAKYGFEPMQLHVIAHLDEVIDIRDRSGRKLGERVYQMLIVRWTGETPRVGDYQLAAVIEHVYNSATKSYNNIIRTLPGFDKEIPQAYRNAAPHCEHCNYDRNRKDTFVVYSEKENQFYQVGSGCLGDYTGVNTPYKAVSIGTFLHEISEIASGDNSFPRKPVEVDLDYFVALSFATIERYGYVSATAVMNGFEGVPTSTQVWGQIIDQMRGINRSWHVEVDEKSNARANMAIDWIRTEFSQRYNLSDFEYNMYTVASLDRIDCRKKGFAAYLPEMYMRDVESKVIEKHQAQYDGKISEHVGEIDKRMEFDNLTCTHVQYIESQFGVKRLVKFLDVNSNIVTMFYSGQDDYEIGQVYSGKATVKRHEEFNGNKETHINRPKFEKQGV